MKTIIYKTMTSICLCMVIAVYGCIKQEVRVSYYNEDTADFTVKNLTTNEEIVNEELQTGTLETLIAHPGDRLQLSYTPPLIYENYDWDVEFTLFGETIKVNEVPYTAEYTVSHKIVGDYRITCEASMTYSETNGKDDGEIIIANDRGYVRIEMVEE